MRRLVIAALGGALGLALLVGLWPAARVRFLNAVFFVEARMRPLDLAATQRDLDSWIPPRAILLAGDSLIAMLPERSVDALAVNLGRGGVGLRETARQLEGRASLHTARALVLLVGTNDLAHHTAAEAAAPTVVLERLPANLSVIVCAIPPIDPSVHRDRQLVEIDRMNDRWRAAVAARPRTQFVPVAAALADERGALRRELHQGDGLHLNAEGNRRLAALIRQALAQLPP